MFIPCQQISDYLGISCIKKNNKISLNLAEKHYMNNVSLISADTEFPFANPLITDSSLKMFEFIIEANNFFKRKYFSFK